MVSPFSEPVDRPSAVTPAPRRRRAAIIALAVSIVVLVIASGGLYAYYKVTEADWQREQTERQVELDAVSEEVAAAAEEVARAEQSRQMFESFWNQIPGMSDEDRACLDAVQAYLADAADGSAELTFVEACTP
jgi:hypothetical protein